MGGPPAPQRVLATLVDAVRMEDAWVRVLTEPGDRAAVVDLVAEGDRRQGADPAFRRELAAWLHPNHSHAGDGMRGSAFGMPEVASIATVRAYT